MSTQQPAPPGWDVQLRIWDLSAEQVVIEIPHCSFSKLGKTPTRMQFKVYVMMLQYGSTIILTRKQGNLASKAGLGRKLGQISLQSLHTLSCSVVWNIANVMAYSKVHLTRLMEKYGWEKNICLSYCYSPEGQKNPVLQLFWLRIINPPLHSLSFLDSVHLSAKVSCWAEQSEDGLVPILVGERLLY